MAWFKRAITFKEVLKTQLNVLIRSLEECQGKFPLTLRAKFLSFFFLHVSFNFILSLHFAYIEKNFLKLYILLPYLDIDS